MFIPHHNSATDKTAGLKNKKALVMRALDYLIIKLILQIEGLAYRDKKF